MELRFSESDAEIVEHIIGLKLIKFLHLDYIKGNGWMCKLARGLPELQELHLDCIENFGHIIEEIIEMLPHAKQLSFLKLALRYWRKMNININLEIFNKLKNIIKQRPKPIKLLIEIQVPDSYVKDQFKSQLLDVVYRDMAKKGDIYTDL